MTQDTPTRNRFRKRRLGSIPASLAGVCVAALLLSGCSSPTLGDFAGPEGKDAVSSALEQLQSLGADIGNAGDPDIDPADADSAESGDSGAPAQQDPPPIKLRLPAEPSGDPAGWQRTTVTCVDIEKSIGSAYVGFAVPGEWEPAGKGGGSGSPQGMGFDFSFNPADAGKLKVRIESDARDGDGALTKGGEPVTDPTFDYNYAVDDDEKRITFDSLGEVPVGDSTAELFVARPEQAPDRLKDVVYKARVDQFDMPTPKFDGSWTVQPNTFVITLSHNPEKGEIAEETVKSIVSSLVMPECSLINAVVLSEMSSGLDVDGDGHVADQQDFMDALQMGSGS